MTPGESSRNQVATRVLSGYLLGKILLEFSPDATILEPGDDSETTINV